MRISEINGRRIKCNFRKVIIGKLLIYFDLSIIHDGLLTNGHVSLILARYNCVLVDIVTIKNYLIKFLFSKLQVAKIMRIQSNRGPSGAVLRFFISVDNPKIANE